MIDKSRLLAGRYHLLEQIDAGGTAFVYKAKDEMTGQIVAVKILRPELTKNQEFVLRFKKEVQASLKLRHANIIKAYDAGLDNDMYYIVMELVEGKTLKHLINKKGPLPVKYVVGIAKKLCLALEYAHVKGFVHRDIKPHNVMLDADGEPYIADFGIAKNLAQSTITLEDNSVMGSVHYFSPEQARGERADRRSDIYSLGILLYEMLTGSVPFDADTSIAIALKHINEELPDMKEANPAIPESLSRIVIKSTQKDKHFRYKSAFTVYEDLQRCLAEPDGEYIKYTESKRTQQRSQQQLEEVYANRSKKSVKNIFVTIGIGIAVVAVVVLVLSIVLHNLASRDVVLPDVVGLTEQSAGEVLEDEGFEVSVERVNSMQTVGTVLRQSPRAETAYPGGSEVILSVSAGTLVDTMPVVTDMAQEQAESMLLEAGLDNIHIIKETEGDMPIGYVLWQQPMAGEPIPENGEVILYVKISPDEKKITVPDVVGSGLADAVATLKKSGFVGSTIFVIEGESPFPVNRVIAQEPVSGTEQLNDQPMFLTIPEPEGGVYTYSGDPHNVRVEEDQTMVVVTVADVLGGTQVYRVVSAKAMPAGMQEIELDGITLTFDSQSETLEKSLVIFVGNRMEVSESIQMERTGERD